ncbi:uncharacterized protein N7459_001825 [Penicillium hispanicum]|uniref:uncharacterized protein n=1 Tax=Penicillium hispanicum TaxID=1080232 RepID=UPI00253FD101|nr:uncharacterized protein N7459_001825 [Penicillium hispanicum]KAJ5591456.1 hypothetical protein N7459_001825 [Penicillium hispanicum]
MAPLLQQKIDEISTLNLSDAIHALTELTTAVTTSVSANGEFLMHHPLYEEPGRLDDLGRHFLDAARRCQDEHASFELRLLHHSLDEVFTNIYTDPHKTFCEGYANGTIVVDPSETQGCACCSGKPWAVILYGLCVGDALWYEEAEYRRIWGDAESCGMRHILKRDSDEQEGDTWLMASKEQIEEAMSRKPGPQVASRL